MMTVSRALRSRRSVRAYTDECPPLETVKAILDAARWSPSGSNMQPWNVIVVAGRARDAVCELARRALADNPAGEEGDYPVCPADLPSPFKDRRSLAARQRYVAMGIERGDVAARAASVARNYDFWGAPVGLFFVTDRRLGHSQWCHLGMFIQSVALVSAEKGLGSCVQESWAMVRESLHRHFSLCPHDVIYCGMALGFADDNAPVNAFRSAREPVAAFAKFFGFAE